MWLIKQKKGFRYIGYLRKYSVKISYNHFATEDTLQMLEVNGLVLFFYYHIFIIGLLIWLYKSNSLLKMRSSFWLYLPYMKVLRIMRNIGNINLSLIDNHYCYHMIFVNIWTDLCFRRVREDLQAIVYDINIQLPFTLFPVLIWN